MTSTTEETSGQGPKLWTPGDWNALFGLGTNVLVNLLVMTGLLKYVVGLPDELTFGRILPATGLMLFLSTLYYAWLAWRLARQSGRDDVCALPSGISVQRGMTWIMDTPISVRVHRRPQPVARLNACVEPMTE